jgi:hypothetical protein
MVWNGFAWVNVGNGNSFPHHHPGYRGNFGGSGLGYNLEGNLQDRSLSQSGFIPGLGWVSNGTRGNFGHYNDQAPSYSRHAYGYGGNQAQIHLHSNDIGSFARGAGDFFGDIGFGIKKAVTGFTGLFTGGNRRFDEYPPAYVDSAPQQQPVNGGYTPLTPSGALETQPVDARTQMQNVQAMLETLGFATQGGDRQRDINDKEIILINDMDGRDGALTSAALAEVQKLKGLGVTGDVDDATVNALQGLLQNPKEFAAFKQQVQADVSSAHQGTPNVPKLNTRAANGHSQ